MDNGLLCGACGTMLPQGSRFCSQCGTPLGTPDTTLGSEDDEPFLTREDGDALLSRIEQLETLVAESFDQVITKAFLLIDGENKPKIQMRVRPDGLPEVVLRDNAGHGRIHLSITPDGYPEITLDDQHGHPRAFLSVLADGTSALSLDGSTGRPLVDLVVSENAPRLSFWNTRGDLIGRFP